MVALGNYTCQAADLHAGRKPRELDAHGTPSIKDIANSFLAMQKEKAERELISPVWFDDCPRTVKDFVVFSGKNRPWDDLRPGDFGKYRMRRYDRYGVCGIDRAIAAVRGVLKHTYESDLIDRPVKYGGQFKKPTLKEKPRSRTERDRANGTRIFEPAQVRLTLEQAQGQLGAMILLGINGGFGNTDCAELPIAALDLDGAVIEYEGPK